MGKLGWASDTLRKIVGVRTPEECKAIRRQVIAKANKGKNKAQKPFKGKV